MTDITLCKDKQCPFKDTCYRYTANPSEYQSWFAESPRQGNECKMYWGDQSQFNFMQLQDIVKGRAK